MATMELAQPVLSPDSDVSPKTADPSTDKQAEYFPVESSTIESNNTAGGSNTSVKTSEGEGEGEGEVEGDASSGRKSSISFVAELPTRPARDSSEAQVDSRMQMSRRKSSVSFLPPRNPSLPQGNQKQADGSRLRERSPAHERYVCVIAFFLVS